MIITRTGVKLALNLMSCRSRRRYGGNDPVSCPHRLLGGKLWFPSRTVVCQFKGPLQIIRHTKCKCPHVFAMHYAGGGLISTSTKSRGSFALCQECDQLGF